MKQPIILLREDDDTFCELITDIAKQTLQDCKVIRVQSSTEILKLPELADSNLLITDLYGRGGYGINIIRELRQQNIGLPVLVISGNINDAAKMELEASGITYFRKPFRVQMLAEYLNNAFAKLQKQ